jgi:hypothetical protein
MIRFFETSGIRDPVTHLYNPEDQNALDYKYT